jgi:hypothetical protein
VHGQVISSHRAGLFSLRVKRLGCEIDHCPSSAEVRNEWSYNCALFFAFGAWTRSFHLPFFNRVQNSVFGTKEV